MLLNQRTNVLLVPMLFLACTLPNSVLAQTESDDLNTNELNVDAVEPEIALPEIRRDENASLRVQTISLGLRKQSSDGLVSLAQEAVDTTSRRLLSSNQHTPWQMMHALLGLRQEFAIIHQQQEVNGLDWIAQGQEFNGDQWFQKTEYGGRAHPYSVPYAFEGHANQMLAVLSMCGLETDHQFQTADGPITIADMIEHAKMTCDTKRDEPTWTLWALSRYLAPDAVWRNENGDVCSIELLVADQTKRPLKGAACGGTHGLFALAHARNVYLREGKPLRGVWLQSENKIRYYINTARRLQNPNGTLSSNYLRTRTYNPDFNKRMASSGHVLEFLMLALPQNELNHRWVRRAIETTARDLLNNRKEYVKCSPLYHSVNALNIYLDRVNPRQEVPQTAKIPSPRTAMVNPQNDGRRIPARGISQSRVLDNQKDSVDDIASRPVNSTTAPEASQPTPSTASADQTNIPLPTTSSATATAEAKAAAKAKSDEQAQPTDDSNLPLNRPANGRLNFRTDKAVAEAIIQQRMDELETDSDSNWKATNPNRLDADERQTTDGDAATDAAATEEAATEEKAEEIALPKEAYLQDSNDVAEQLIQLKPVKSDSQRLKVIVPNTNSKEIPSTKLAPLMAKKESAVDAKDGSPVMLTDNGAQTPPMTADRPLLPNRLHTGSRRSNPFSVERPISRSPLTIPTTTVSQSRTVSQGRAVSREDAKTNSLDSRNEYFNNPVEAADQAESDTISEDTPSNDQAYQELKNKEFQTVPSGINDPFLDLGLKPEDWVNRFEVESREVYSQRHQIVKAVALSVGDSIADVGAGTGLFTELFSKTVGTDGKVYAIDISPRLITHLENRVATEGLSNVTVVRNDASSTQLVTQKVDKAFVCDTYHHFEQPKAMLNSIHRALNDSGELVLVDFERIPGQSRDWVIGHVRAGKTTFRAEIEASGFEFVREAKVDGFKENYLLIFRKK